MKLKEYASRRKFERTPEPRRGRRTGQKQLCFIVHKHAARTVHYDLRLELEGVLKSWAVPKGPSLDPSKKRLAVMVEDHPLDYREFEGIIPEGNYGAGSVIVWDRGFYRHPSATGRNENEKLLLDGLEKGDMKFVIEGQKLHGEFALVKTQKDDASWLLLKKKDRYASKEEVLRENRSVMSDRTLEEVSESGRGEVPRRKIERLRLREAMESEALEDAPSGPMPHDIEPMLATPAKRPFDHPDWIFEVKWDGYRAIAEVRDGDVSLYSRNHLPLNRKYAPVADSLGKLGFDAVLDGEIVVVDDQGRSDFQMLQNYQRAGGGRLLYYVFDILHFQGKDLTSLPLVRRKELLKRVLSSVPAVRFSEHVKEEGIAFFNAAKEKGIEGIVAKHSQSVYLMGKRSRKWLKVKTRLTQEGVIAGFTKPRGSRRNFGTLVLGAFEGREFVFIGTSGGGFTARSLKDIREKLTPLIQAECPFNVKPKTNTSVTWVKPELVCEIVFQGWTDEGIMRQPVFLRLRDDKSPRDVVLKKGERA